MLLQTTIRPKYSASEEFNFLFRWFSGSFSWNMLQITHNMSVWIFKKMTKIMNCNNHTFCAAHKYSKLRLQHNIWIFMQFHKGEIDMIIIHHTRSDVLFKVFQHLSRYSTPWHQHSGRQVYTTGIWQRVCMYIHVLNEVGQGVCVQVYSEVKTASTSNIICVIISINVGWEKS